MGFEIVEGFRRGILKSRFFIPSFVLKFSRISQSRAPPWLAQLQLRETPAHLKALAKPYEPSRVSKRWPVQTLRFRKMCGKPWRHAGRSWRTILRRMRCATESWGELCVYCKHVWNPCARRAQDVRKECKSTPHPSRPEKANEKASKNLHFSVFGKLLNSQSFDILGRVCVVFFFS